jgi:hypothetical protein
VHGDSIGENRPKDETQPELEPDNTSPQKGYRYESYSLHSDRQRFASRLLPHPNCHPISLGVVGNWCRDPDSFMQEAGGVAQIWYGEMGAYQ